VDLGTDMLPALALGAERPHRSLMEKPPRPAGERLLSWSLLARAYLWLGLLQAAAATTACFTAIVAAQVVNVFACRHPEESAFRLGLTSNRLLLAGVGAEIALLLLFVYTPIGNAFLGTAPLEAPPWFLIVVLAVAFGLLEELRKWFWRRRARPRPIAAAAV
jgi:sodium/potassium-transporting ATPase subunit alpha